MSYQSARSGKKFLKIVKKSKKERLTELKKSRRKDKYSLKLIKCPYKESDTDGIKEYYERYMNNENRTFGKDGRTYYRIIECREWRINRAPILVMVDAKSYFNLVDKLIDENGVVYEIYSYPMFRILCDNFPNWSQKLLFVALKGEPYTIGDYLARYEK